MMLICALKPEEIIGIVAAVVLVLSLASIIITAVRSYTLKKKACKIVENENTDECSENLESSECSCCENGDIIAGEDSVADTVCECAESNNEAECECSECNCDACEQGVVEEVSEEKAPIELDNIAENEQEDIKNEVVADTIIVESVESLDKTPQKKVKKQVKKAEPSLIESEVPFAQAMLESTDKIKGFYNQLKSELMSFEGVKNSITKKGETFKLNGVLLAKFAKGERFVVGFASNKVNTLAEKYGATISTDKLFDLAPVTFIVKSQATAKVCTDIMNNELKEQFGLAKKAKIKDIDYIMELEKK